MAFGLSKAQASNIVNYRDKSGGFKDEAHFRKLYCMADELFALISPYLVLQSKAENGLKHCNQEAKEKRESKAQSKVREVLSWIPNVATVGQQIRGGRDARIYKYGKRWIRECGATRFRIDNAFEQTKGFKIGKTEER